MTSSMTGSRGPTGTSTGQTSSGKSFKEKIPKGYKQATLQQFTPEQLELFQHMMSFAGPESFLSKLAGGDPELMAQMEEPALRQFSQMQGGLASRFSGMGGLGARRSSGFQNTANQAAADFAKDLQAQRLGLQRQATMDLGQMSQMLMGQRPFQRSLVEKQQKQGLDWGALGGSALGALGGFAVGGPMGAMTGASMGYGIGSGKGSNTQFQSSPNWDFNNFMPIIGGAI